jgi:hypothetical protein
LLTSAPSPLCISQVLLTLLHNAGAERALAAGVSKSLLGLGAAVFSCVYVSFLKPNARSYLLLCALTPPAIALVATPFLQRLPRPELHLARRSAARASRLWGLGCWVALLCAYLLAANAATQGEPTHAVRVGTTVGLVVLLVFPPLGLTLANLRSTPAASPVEHDAEQCGPPAAAASTEVAHAAAPAPPRLRGQRSSELTLAGCMRCTEFWLMFVALSAGGGCALALINNLAQVTAALHSPQGAESFVALFSVCNAGGRLLQGSLADWALRMGATPPTFLVVALLILSATQLALASATPERLHACVAVTGLCFGSFWSLAPVAVGELFGERHAGVIYGAIGTSPAIGSFLLNTLLAGYVYDHHTRFSPPPPPGAPPSAALHCVGRQCFALTFQVCSVAATVGALCAYTLLVRTRHMYSGHKP